MRGKRDFDAPFWMALRQAKYHIIKAAMANAETVEQAANMLGITPVTLWRQAKEVGIKLKKEKERNARAANGANRA